MKRVKGVEDLNIRSVRAQGIVGVGADTYTFTRRPDGLTDIDVVVVRDGKTLKGWFLGLVLGTIGKGVLEKAFKNSVKAIEARNGTARAARSS
jgi:hypothetical protein